MELKSIELKHNGKFFKRYDYTYINRVGNKKIYEVISREEINSIEDVKNNKSMAVVLFVYNADHTKILLNKEFRMAANDYVVNIPAGLIEQGEEIEETARRELKEETGLDLIRVVDVMEPTYSAVGVSNEKTSCVVCEAEGVLGGNPEDDEDIEPFWVDKEGAKELLKGKDILLAARTQMLLYMWVNN